MEIRNERQLREEKRFWRPLNHIYGEVFTRVQCCQIRDSQLLNAAYLYLLTYITQLLIVFLNCSV